MICADKTDIKLALETSNNSFLKLPFYNKIKKFTTFIKKIFVHICWKFYKNNYWKNIEKKLLQTSQC